jgi:ATP-dependent Clp protease ATP-binding subunit ClpA
MARTAIELAGVAVQREQPGRALSAIVELRDRLDELEEFHVENAREQGWSWSEIAQPLRVTRQAVHHKYSKRLEDARRGARRGRMVVSPDARRSVVRARREAAALGHDSVGTDHLLLGLLVEETTAGALIPLGVSFQRTRAAVVELRRSAIHHGRAVTRGEEIPISERARKALEQSLREALRLGDEQIGAKHVLLASLRDEASAARRVLDRLGVAPAAVEERLET